MRNLAMISTILGMALFMGCDYGLSTPPEPSSPMGPSHLRSDDNGLSDSLEDSATEAEGNDSTDS